MKLFIIIFLLLFVDIASASVEYGDGWRKICSDDGRCSYSNYHTIMKWNGEYIPYSWLNIDNGNWTYNLSQNSTHYNLSRLDDLLVLPKNFANYTFDLTKISFSFTVTPAQLNIKSTANGSGQWYITVPDKAAKTRFIWDDKKPFVYRNNNQNDYLNDTEYWYSKVDDQIRLNYNQAARNFGIASTNITFSFDSWTVGSGGSAWSGNSSMDNTTLTGNNDNNVIPSLQADYANRPDNNNISADGKWIQSATTAMGINSSAFNFTTTVRRSLYVFYNNTVNANISMDFRDYDNNITNTDERFGIFFHRQTADTAANTAGYRLIISPNSTRKTALLAYHSGSSSTTLETLNNVVINNSEPITIVTSTVGTGLTVLKGGNTWLSFTIGNTSYTTGYVGFEATNVPTNENMMYDNFTIWTQTYGNLTTWYDSGTGNETYQLDVNFSTIPTNTNYTTYYRQNATGDYVQVGTANNNANQSISLSTKYQNTDVIVQLFGNTTARPELMSITFQTQSSSVTTFSQNVYNTGWQTIFVNSTQSMTSISGMMNSSNVKWVSWWNATSQKWQTFKQGWTYRQNNQATAGDAVYIKFTNNATVTRNNATGSYNWTTKVNWNLLGLDFNGSKTLTLINTSVNSGGICDADKIVYYNLQTLAESTFTCGQAGNASVAVNQGEGFWVNATVAFDRVRSW